MTSIYEIHVVHLLRHFWRQDGWIWHNEQYDYLFSCLLFNGTFSTNRLSHAIAVGYYIK